MRTILIFLSMFIMSIRNTRAQSHDLVQLGLNIEKLNQFRQILADMRRAYTVISRGYGTVRDLTQGNFQLHNLFLDGLMAVSPSVARYRRVPEIIATHRIIIAEYKSALSRFQQKGILTQEQLGSIRKVYTGLFDRSVRSIEDLVLVVTGGALRMNDAERLEAIDRIFVSSQEDLAFLRRINLSASGFSRLQEGRLQEIQQLIGR